MPFMTRLDLDKYYKYLKKLFVNNLIKMGAQSSRRLPQKIVSNVKSSAIETHSANKITNEPIIREARDKIIEDDGKDPHLLKNLFTIGQVNVPKEKEPFKQSDDMLKILRNRKAFDKEIESEIPKNRIFVYELREMLEQRKNAPDEFTAEKLSNRYNLDASTIEALLNHINTFTLTGGVKSRAAWVEDSRLFRKNESTAASD